MSAGIDGDKFVFTLCRLLALNDSTQVLEDPNGGVQFHTILGKN